MKILLTNDDGIDAFGISTLAKKLQESGHEIIVIAPDKEQSATSHSITLHQPLRIIEKEKNWYAVTGSPADCMILAAKVILKSPIDLVISGINNGQNMAEDVLYSGTVAAALEAMFMGYKAVAVSVASKTDQKYDTAAHFVDKMLNDGLHKLISDNEVLNINIPNTEINEVKGIKITFTGQRRYKDFVTEQTDPRGKKIYWIGGAKPFWVDEEGSDFKAISGNYISITPIAPNFTKRRSFDKIIDWVKNSSIFEEI